MNKTQQTVQEKLEELSMEIFGRSRSLAQAGNSCVKCGKPATQFRDELSLKEYQITGFCNDCQDEFYSEIEP